MNKNCRRTLKRNSIRLVNVNSLFHTAQSTRKQLSVSSANTDLRISVKNRWCLGGALGNLCCMGRWG
jgi:hypothetical protein